MCYLCIAQHNAQHWPDLRLYYGGPSIHWTKVSALVNFKELGKR